jgi:anti-anti-sigma factor
MANDDIVAGFDDENDTSLKIRLQKIDDIPSCLVLYLTGGIDTYNSENFQKRVAKAIEGGFNKLIFNVSGTHFASPTEIECYTAFLKAVKPKGGDLVLLEMQPKVKEAYKLLGFSKSFNIKENLEEAILVFTGSREDDNRAIFPGLFKCPICAKKLKASKAGRFRCSGCKTILAIDSEGQVSLGQR